MAEVTPAALTPGTPEWAQRAPGFVTQALHIILRELASLPQLIEEMKQHRIWETCNIPNWESFCNLELHVEHEVVTGALSFAAFVLRTQELREAKQLYESHLAAAEAAKEALQRKQQSLAHYTGFLNGSLEQPSPPSTIDDSKASALTKTQPEPPEGATTGSPQDSVLAALTHNGPLSIEKVAEYLYGESTATSKSRAQKVLQALKRKNQVQLIGTRGSYIWVVKDTHDQTEKGASSKEAQERPPKGAQAEKALTFMRAKGETTSVELAQALYGESTEDAANKASSYLTFLKKKGLIRQAGKSEKRIVWVVQQPDVASGVAGLA